MIELSLALPDEAATARFGETLAPLLQAGDVIGLSGPVGAGKTTLARAIIGALTTKTETPSPTFMLVEPYETPDFTVFHFDLYRLEKAEEVFELGFEEALSGVSLVEWPERIENLLPRDALIIGLSMDENRRHALVRGGEEWRTRLLTLTRLKDRKG